MTTPASAEHVVTTAEPSDPEDCAAEDAAFRRLLPNLVRAYDRGQLVPFLGAGMSMRACPSWDELVATLGRRANVPMAGDAAGAGLTRRAARVAERLRRESPTAFTQAVRDALYSRETPGNGGPGPTTQTRALAALPWPLVVTTNYDEQYEQAYALMQNHNVEARPVTVLGRSAADCRQVLAALSAPAGPQLWAVHGYLPASAELATSRGAAELVLGHDEFRRIAHAEPHYRRAFTEVQRRRSLLFLGCGLTDDALLGLFEEAHELYGTNPLPHFALLPAGSDLDLDFLRRQYNIHGATFDWARKNRFDAVPRWLGELADTIKAARPRQTRWVYRSGVDRHHAGPPSRNMAAHELAVVRGPLPEVRLGPTDAVVISVGLIYPDNRARVWVSEAPRFRAYVANLDPDFTEDAYRGRLTLQDEVYESAGRGPAGVRLAAVCPWAGPLERDIDRIRSCTVAALRWASRHGLTRLCMPVIGSGAGRHFPAAAALAEMTRGWALWTAEHGAERAVQLEIYVVDDLALYDLGSGRLDLSEALDEPGHLRFWVEVTDAAGHVTRELALRHEDDAVEHLCSDVAIREAADWVVETRPARVERRAVRALGDVWGTSLRELGVYPGSVVTLRRPSAVA